MSRKILESKVHLDTHNYRVQRKRGNIFTIHFKKLEGKLAVMREKKELKGTNIWIDDDHTKREIEIQKWIRRIAKEKREQGERVSFGYMTLICNGEVMKYNERKGILEKKHMAFRNREENGSRAGRKYTHYILYPHYIIFQTFSYGTLTGRVSSERLRAS